MFWGARCSFFVLVPFDLALCFLHTVANAALTVISFLPTLCTSF